VLPIRTLAKTVIDERRLYITKLLHRSTPSSSKSRDTKPPTTKSARLLETTSTVSQSRIWLPSLDNMAVPTISVHQVCPLQQTLRMPDHQDISTSKSCNISNRTTPMPSHSTTHPSKIMRPLSLDQSSMAKGEVLGLVILLNTTMVLFPRLAANGHRRYLGIPHTGRRFYRTLRPARKRIAFYSRIHAKGRPVPIRPDQSRRSHRLIHVSTSIPD